MPVSSTTSVSNSNPGSITVTVEDTTGAGNNNGNVDIILSVDPAEAVFLANPAPTAGYILNASHTVIAWRNKAFSQNNPVVVTAYLNLAAETNPPLCVGVTGTVIGVYAGADYLASLYAVVCIPEP